MWGGRGGGLGGGVGGGGGVGEKKKLTLLSKQSVGGGVDLNSKRVLQLVS